MHQNKFFIMGAGVHPKASRISGKVQCGTRICSKRMPTKILTISKTSKRSKMQMILTNRKKYSPEAGSVPLPDCFFAVIRGFSGLPQA